MAPTTKTDTKTPRPDAAAPAEPAPLDPTALTRSLDRLTRATLAAALIGRNPGRTAADVVREIEKYWEVL